MVHTVDDTEECDNEYKYPYHLRESYCTSSYQLPRASVSEHEKLSVRSSIRPSALTPLQCLQDHGQLFFNTAPNG